QAGLGRAQIAYPHYRNGGARLVVDGGPGSARRRQNDEPVQRGRTRPRCEEPPSPRSGAAHAAQGGREGMASRLVIVVVFVIVLRRHQQAGPAICNRPVDPPARSKFGARGCNSRIGTVLSDGWRGGARREEEAEW